MQKHFFWLIGLVMMFQTLLQASPQNSTCQNIIELQKRYDNTPSPQLLLAIGEMASKLEVSLDEYEKDTLLATSCHLKVVKSANYGDFASYDGYHFKKLLLEYPQSDLVDDATYHLIYISDDVNNFTDLTVEKAKLQKFIKDYPKSNLAPKAKKRIAFITQHIKKGGESILD
ncbi:MAG: hypothetical protein KU38_02440 [Sulfurovum sp. FS08-3]|nr:MAG: hypothetical protein KU38_02440 [Sulfurovum sp. FS08-3]